MREYEERTRRLRVFAPWRERFAQAVDEGNGEEAEEDGGEAQDELATFREGTDQEPPAAQEHVVQRRVDVSGGPADAFQHRHPHQPHADALVPPDAAVGETGKAKGEGEEEDKKQTRSTV